MTSTKHPYQICLNHDTIMKVLEEISQGEAYPMSNEISRDYISLLYTAYTIHTLFHASNPFLNVN